MAGGVRRRELGSCSTRVEPLTTKKLAAMNQVFALGASQESAPTLCCKTGGSPSNSSFFAESTGADTPCSRFSPEYADSQHHSGFDPNVVFPSCGLDLNRLLDLSSPDLRRYPADPTHAQAGRSLSFDVDASHVIDGTTTDAGNPTVPLQV